jgi:engulfment/cell motility protein 1
MTERAKFVESLIPLTRIVQKDAVQKWIIHSVLEIAAILVLHAPAGFQLVNEKLGLGEIIKHIQSMPAGTTSPPDLQEAAVKLINSMITACPPAHRLAFFGELKRHQIINALMPRVTSPGGVEEGMAHALYVLQTNFVMEDQGDVAAAPIVWDKTNVDGLGLITRLATAKSGTANDSPKKLALLGFPDITNAKVAFEEYPGAVALDCISFLARKSPEIYKQYEKMADKPAEYRCPFIRAGRDITALLLRILDVVPGSTPDETSTGYLPLYFTTPKAFQELFCVAMEVMAVTWVDMEAINIDQDKVVLVVEKQIRNVLDHHELKAAPDIRMFREAVLKHKYNDVQQAEVKAMSDQFTAQMASAVVKEVKEQIRPETIQLVQRQRLAVMGKGDFFSTVEKGRITTKRFYAVLSPNHKTLHWSDPKDDYQVGSSEHRPTIAQLPPATTGEGGGYVAVEDIHMFEVGVEIAALKALKSKPNDDFVARTFAILIGQEEWLTFVAPTRGSGVVWIDGLRVLMRKPNREHETVKEWQQLLDLQMHLRLMDTHGVTLPTGKPQVPALPTQFNFLYADTADQSPA